MKEVTAPLGTWALHEMARFGKSTFRMQRSRSPLRRLRPRGWVIAKRVKAAWSR